MNPPKVNALKREISLQDISCISERERERGFVSNLFIYLLNLDRTFLFSKIYLIKQRGAS